MSAPLSTIPDWLGAILPGLKGVPSTTPHVFEVARSLFAAPVVTPTNPIPLVSSGQSLTTARLLQGTEAAFRRTLPDLMPSVPMEGGVLRAPSITTIGTAKPHKETEAKLEAGLAFGGSDEKAITVAAWVRMSDELLDDTPGLEAWLSQYLGFIVSSAEEEQIIKSDGTGATTPLRGFFTPGLCTAYAGAAGATFEATLSSAIAQAATSGWLPDTAVISIADWGALATSGSRSFDPGLQQYAGLALVASPFLAAGALVVGPAQGLAVIGREGGVIVEGTRSHLFDFTANLATVRAASRFAFALLMPKAFVVKAAA